MGRLAYQVLARALSIGPVFIKDEERAEASSFGRAVLNLLKRAEYLRCGKDESLEGIYRYKAYRFNDMVQDSENHVIDNELCETPNVHLFSIHADQPPVSAPQPCRVRAAAMFRRLKTRRGSSAHHSPNDHDMTGGMPVVDLKVGRINMWGLA